MFRRFLKFGFFAAVFSFLSVLPSVAFAAPSTPTDVNASAISPNEIEITWSGVSGYTYDIKMGTDLRTGITGSRFVWSGLQPSTRYVYFVRAVDRFGVESPYSLEVSATTFSLAATAPSGVSVVALSSRSVQVSWTMQAGLSYAVYSEGGTLLKDFFEGNTFTHTSLQPNTRYGYKIRARSANSSTSDFSSIYRVVTPSDSGSGSVASPSGLTATALNSREIRLQWNTYIGYTYAVYRGGVLVRNYSNSGLFTDSNLNIGAQYTYMIRTKDSSGNTTDSPNITVTTLSVSSDGGSGSGSVNVRAVANSSSKITLSWDAASGVKYGVFLDDGRFLRGYRESGEYIHTGLLPEKTYTYIIKTEKDGEVGRITVTTLREGQTASDTSASNESAVPVPTVVAESDDTIRVSWRGVEGYSYAVFEEDGTQISDYITRGYFVVEGLLSGQSYTYYIRGKSGSGALSEASKKVSATTWSGKTPQVAEGCAALTPGTLLRIRGGNTVYYLHSDYHLYPFFSERDVKSWYPSGKTVRTVETSCARSYPYASRYAPARPGSFLLKGGGSAAVYAIAEGRTIRKLENVDTARALYGSSWRSRVVDVPDTLIGSYIRGPVLSDKTRPHDGQLVYATSTVFRVQGGMRYRVLEQSSSLKGAAVKVQSVVLSGAPLGGSAFSRKDVFNIVPEISADGSDAPLSVPKQCKKLAAGAVFKAQGSSAVYRVSSDGKREGFASEQAFLSQYGSFDGVVEIDEACLDAYGPSTVPARIRAGGALVRLPYGDSVYAVYPGGVLRKLSSASVASGMYGDRWSSLVIRLTVDELRAYTFGEDVGSGNLPHAGQIVRFNNTTYYYDGNEFRPMRDVPAHLSRLVRSTRRSYWEVIPVSQKTISSDSVDEATR